MADTTKPSMSDERVQARTGKTWDEWFGILDKAGAADMPHPQIAQYIADNFDMPGWWCQTVTVEYERTRGLRAKHQTSRGFEVSVSKTLPVSLADLYDAWQDETRQQWLPDPVEVRRTASNKSMRMTWPNDNSTIEVRFYARGDDKAQVVVQHSKLPGPDDVERMRSTWKGALGRLSETLAANTDA
ncbi:MAG: SRPBCC domain-containing protein [Dehalococcoidia bacterium]